MTHCLFTDITQLDVQGIDRWVKEFHWPVSSTEYEALTQLVQSQWERACLELAGEDSDVAFSDSSPNWIVALAHAAVVRIRTQRVGTKLVVGQQSRLLYTPDWECLARGHDLLLTQPTWRFTIRRWLRNAAFNRELPFGRRLGVFVNPNAVALGSNDPLRAQYAGLHKLGVDNTYLPLLLTGASNRSLSPELRRQVLTFLDSICTSVAQQFGTPLDLHGMCQAIEGRLGTLLAVHRQVSRCARAVPLLVTESAKSLHKVAACAWRAGGGTAVGFHHGHAAGEMSLPARAYTEFFAYDEFICPTEASALAFAADYETTPLAELRPTRFTVADATQYSGASVSRRSTNGFPRRVRRVMVMGFPMNSQRYLGHKTLFWAYQLELEIKLVKLLVNSHFDVLYKAHPERPHPVSEVMDALGCTVILEPFEQVHRTADAFIVNYTFSSTFPVILGSERPVYLLDFERALWKPVYRDLLAKRCVIIPVEADSEGRIQFDENQLLRRLSGEQSYPDYSYVERYYPAHCR
jgi:hypothetical protein